MSKNLLEKKRYRLIKVLFIICFLGVFVGSVSTVISDGKPYTNYYSSTYSYKCNTGEIRGSFDYSDLINVDYQTKSFKYVDFKDENGRKVARSICFNEKFFNSLSPQDKTQWINDVVNGDIKTPFQIKNYEIVFKYEDTIGTWGGFAGKLIAAILGPIIIFSLIRYIFFYVVLGKHKYIFNEIRES